jgi:hypothetical protein
VVACLGVCCLFVCGVGGVGLGCGGWGGWGGRRGAGLGSDGGDEVVGSPSFPHVDRLLTSRLEREAVWGALGWGPSGPSVADDRLDRAGYLSIASATNLTRLSRSSSRRRAGGMRGHVCPGLLRKISTASATIPRRVRHRTCREALRQRPGRNLRPLVWGVVVGGWGGCLCDRRQTTLSVWPARSKGYSGSPPRRHGAAPRRETTLPLAHVRRGLACGSCRASPGHGRRRVCRPEDVRLRLRAARCSFRSCARAQPGSRIRLRGASVLPARPGGRPRLALNK